MYYDEEEYYVNPEDYLEQYEVEVREIILKAMNDKIKKTIEELKTERENNKKLEERNQELRTKLYNIEKQSKQQLEVALKEKELETHRKLSTGFAVNDIVYYIKSKSTSTKCEKCNGKGKVEIEVLDKKTEVKCPHCSYGTIYHYTYYPEKDTISSIKFWVRRKDNYDKRSPGILHEKWDIDMWLDRYDNSIRRDNLYKSLEECQKACDEKNKKEDSKTN